MTKFSMNINHVTTILEAVLTEITNPNGEKHQNKRLECANLCLALGRLFLGFSLLPCILALAQQLLLVYGLMVLDVCTQA